MNYNLLWIFLLILQEFAASHPIHTHDSSMVGLHQESNDSFRDSTNEKVISVRVTSSVAVGRGNGKPNQQPSIQDTDTTKYLTSASPTVTVSTTLGDIIKISINNPLTEMPPHLPGANIEYLKQLNAKKDSRDHAETIHPFQTMIKSQLDEYESSHSDHSYNLDDNTTDMPQAARVQSTPDFNQLHKSKQFYQDTNPLFVNNFNSHNRTNNITSFAASNEMLFESNTDLGDIKNETKATNYQSNVNGYKTQDSVAEPSTKIDNISKKLDIRPSKLFEDYGDPLTPSEIQIKMVQDDYVSSHTSRNYEDDDYVTDFPLARKIPSIPQRNILHEQKHDGVYHISNTNLPDEVYFHNASKFNLSNQTLTNPWLESKRNRNENNYMSKNKFHNDDSIAEPSFKSVDYSKIKVSADILPPITESLPGSSLNGDQDFTARPRNEGRINQRLTTVSFNIVHDSTTVSKNQDLNNSYLTTNANIPNKQQDTTLPKQVYEPPIYSQPAKIYSEPAKFYSEPAKIYSEPAKIYSEPAKVYSEPAKIYSEPAKFYSEPASLYLEQNVQSTSTQATHRPFTSTQWQSQSPLPTGSTTINTTPIANSFQMSRLQMEHQPEKNYEVDEKISVLTDGRSHGVQESNTEKCKQDNCKVGYVVEGRQYKKYRVEERTPDGFIVGEYGVVRNEDGDLRGVRYTADSAASPRLIHDALMKFLQLK